MGAGVGAEHLDEPAVARERLVVYVGRLMPYKGADVLVRAIPDDVPLEIYGRHYDERYSRDVRRLAAGKNVSFFPAATDAQISVGTDGQDEVARRASLDRRTVIRPTNRASSTWIATCS